jgi:choline kinase
MKVSKAVITAAGWGTRFLPVNKSQPKEMLPLVNKPLIRYSVEEAIACGVCASFSETGPRCSSHVPQRARREEFNEQVPERIVLCQICNELFGGVDV